MLEVVMQINRMTKPIAVSKKAARQAPAEPPSPLGQMSLSTKRALIIPEKLLAQWKYIPTALFEPDVMVGPGLLVIEAATTYHFGVLSSSMHMAWVRQVCGRLKSDYRYSAKLVYNNYPWPQSQTDNQSAVVEAKAQAVLDVRATYPDCSLATLYDALTMPPKLTKAHAELDRAVDACYRAKPFASDRERVGFLFGLYEKLTAPLTAGLKEPKARRRRHKS